MRARLEKSIPQETHPVPGVPMGHRASPDRSLDATGRPNGLIVINPGLRNLA